MNYAFIKLVIFFSIYFSFISLIIIIIYDLAEF